MDAVYAAGSLALDAEDEVGKGMAARLQIYGFVAIDEVQADGSLRRLKSSESVRPGTLRPWRVSKTFLAWGGASRGETRLA